MPRVSAALGPDGAHTSLAGDEGAIPFGTSSRRERDTLNCLSGYGVDTQEFAPYRLGNFEDAAVGTAITVQGHPRILGAGGKVWGCFVGRRALGRKQTFLVLERLIQPAILLLADGGDGAPFLICRAGCGRHAAHPGGW